MDERIFSAFIKYLDKEHQQILDKIETKQNELRELEREYYEYDGSKRDSLARQLYALESLPQKDNEAIERIRKELNDLPSKEELEVRITQLKEELTELQNSFLSKPFIVAESTLTPHITYKIDIDGLYIVQDPKTGVCYVKQNLDGVALNNYQIETDSNGVPIKEVWIKQDSDTYGMPLKFERQLKITNPTFEVVKPIRKEVTKEIPEYKEVKISKFVPSMQCVCGWNLTDKLRMVFCPNCGKSLYEVFRKQLEDEMKFENDREKKNKKKWKLFK
jgi:predicted RNA-binding Zn-ribbon protein involved in translation (DUF1610 family)